MVPPDARDRAGADPEPAHGDTIRVRTTVLTKRESKSRPTQGIVEFKHQAFSQRDEEVAVCTRQALMHKKSV